MCQGEKRATWRWQPDRSASGWRERRRHARLYESLPVLVRGVAATGEAFELLTVLDNVSAGGLYVRLKHRVEVGEKLFAAICFAADRMAEAPHLRVVVRGRVVRITRHPDGRWGVGVQVVRHRFL